MAVTAPEHVGSGRQRDRVGPPLAVTIAALVGVLAVLEVGILLGVVPLPVAAVSVPFVVMLFAFPVLRRLAVRNAVRRPRETLLVILGSLLGTAIITGSLVVGDTLDSSIRSGAFTTLGPIDEIVVASGLDAGRQATEAALRMPTTDIDGLLPFKTIVVSVSGLPIKGAPRLAEPHASLVEVDFAAASTFGGDPEATGISGPTPAGDRVVVGEDLAERLKLSTGDPVEVFAYGGTRRYVVDRVLPKKGIAGFKNTPGSASPTLFVAPGTIESMIAAGGPTATLAAPPVVAVAVSNRGGVIDGEALTSRVKAQLNEVLRGSPGSVSLAKRALLEEAETAGKQFTQLFGSIGFFSVIAGILLLVNLFVMLAEERKTELGMLRAVGLRRRSLVAAFTLEGWMYALAAASLGAIAGLGVGRLVVLVAAGIFSGEGDFALDLRFTASMGSIRGGIAFGVFSMLATVLVTSVVISRLNVIRAIRDLPEPAVMKRRRSTLVLSSVAIAVGAVLSASGVSDNSAALILIGPSIIGLALSSLLGRYLPRRPTVSVLSALVLLWAITAFDVFPNAFEEADISIFVVQGVLLTISAVLLVSMNQTTIGAGLRRIGGGAKSMSLRLGLAYPLARRFRTGMTLAMYALVMFTLVFITVFSHLFEGQIDSFTGKVSGGFDLLVRSNRSNPVAGDALRARPDVDVAASLAVVGAEFRVEGKGGKARGAGDDGFERWPATGFDASYLAPGVAALTDRAPGLANDRAAYEAVLSDPGKIIVSGFFLQGGGGPPDLVLHPGDKLTIRDPLTRKSRALTIAAIAEAGFGNDRALVSLPSLQEIFGDQVVSTLAMVKVKPGVDPQAVADEINGQFVASGADSDSFRKIVTDNLASQTQFFRLMQGYLALGLVVGIAGLGVVMVRAVRERRRQIGVLRSLGFGAPAVRRAFLAESSFVALEGILIGTTLAIVTAWRLVTNDSFGNELAFSVPWDQLAFLMAATFILSLVATAAPAQQASKIRPAIALRTTD
ncbi:MAG TPA: FtsX-like permease family protein [Acidimicrobiales bacterium]|nr:FtsX-like permease family protein [Acidimicrobiales bacterium]